MPENEFDAELIRNIIAAQTGTTTQTKINRHLKRFVAVRVVLPVMVIGVVAYAANRLNQSTDTDDTNE